MKDIVEKILSVTQEELNKIDMAPYRKYAEAILGGDIEWFIGTAGKEHYRLLMYVSSNIDEENILDIGTFTGLSSLALGHNKKNTVESWDIEDRNVSQNIARYDIDQSNITYNIGNILSSYSDEKLNSVNIIFLDTVHDGVFETELLNKLISINWKGIMIMDDIHYFPDLNKVWNEISVKKFDITEKGHWSGTGLVFFQ